MLLTRKKPTGVTVLELLTVVAIIGILIALLLPVLATIRKKAREAGSQGVIKSLRTALDNHQLERGMYPYDDEIDGAGTIHDTGNGSFNPGYWQTECAPLDSESSDNENNAELVEYLRKGRYLDVNQAQFVDKYEDGEAQLIEYFGNVLIARFLIEAAESEDGGGDGDSGPEVQQLTERVFIWSYGDDRKNGVNAQSVFTNSGATDYDRSEIDALMEFPTSGVSQDDVVGWK